MKLKISLNKEYLYTIMTLVIYLVVPLVVYSGYLANGHVMVNGDGVSYLNSKSLFSESFLKGDPVLWNRFGMLGTPYSADIQTSFFYPLSYLALLMPINVFSNLFYTFSISLGGFFMYLYMKEIQKNKMIAFVTGLIFMFSTILGGVRVEHQNIYSEIIWLPLILLFIQRYIRTDNRKELLFASLAMAIQSYAGFPQITIYSDIFVFIYLVVFMEKSKISFKKRILDILIWLGIYILLITIQILPLLELIKDTGRNEIPYAYFASFSADYKILPMIIFPELFNSIYMPFDEFHSTGIDIEIYLGIIVAIFLIYAIVFHLKDKKIRTFIIFDVLALIYCMIGNIPVLGDLIWKVPILGSFRVPSRMLFVYVFFTIVIFGMILSKLRDRVEAKRLLKFSLVVLVTMILIILVIKSLANSQMSGEKMKEYYAGINVFIPALIFTVSLIALLIVYCYTRFLFNKKHVFNVFVMIVCLVCIMDVSKYSMKHSDFDYVNEMDNRTSSEVDYIKDIQSNDQYRSLAAISSVEQFNDSDKLCAFKGNGNMFYKFNTYNSYLTFESTKTVAHTGLNGLIMPNINSVVHQNNSRLSMASIKYIVDTYHNITKEKVVSDVGELFFDMPDVIIKANDHEINVQSKVVSVSSNEQYLIQFEAETDKSPTMFYVDFYGENYDLGECTASFTVQPGLNKYSGLISTGTETIPDEVYLRIVSQSDSDILIKNFKIYKVISVPFSSVYKVLIDDKNTTIYENVNAKPIIYAADNVADISQYNDFKLDKTSFIENPKTDIIDNAAHVEIIEINNNSVKAKVTAEQEVFINHVQAMYPGWNAYVDGQKVHNYLVNKTIQGTYVPEGAHIVEFRYEPISLYIGIAAAIIGIVLLIIMIRSKKNSKYESDTVDT